MNDDLKAYVDGELPPDAAERLREALARDPALRAEEAAIRRLGESLQAMHAPEVVGREATLAALAPRRRPSLMGGWAFALAGCAAVVFVAAGLSRVESGRGLINVEMRGIKESFAAEVQGGPTIPAVRRGAFIEYVKARGGEVRRDGDGLRAFYPEGAHDGLRRRFLLPEELPWRADGLFVRIAP